MLECRFAPFGLIHKTKHARIVAVKTGWIWDGANWYYMYSNGAMAHDVVIGGYRLSASGAWVQ